MTRTSTALLLLALLSASCSSGREATPSLPAPTQSPVVTASPTKAPPPSAKPVVRARPVAAALQPFLDCTQLVTTLRQEALKEVTAYGLAQPWSRDVVDGPMPMPVAAPAVGGASGSGTTGGGTAAAAPVARDASTFSTTNNQEADVDEPDTLKTDGEVMVVVRQSPPSLVVLDVSGSHPKQVGSLPVSLEGYGLQILMAGRTVVVLGQRVEANASVVVAEVYTVTDPAHPRHLRTFRVSGALVDARFVHGRVLLVTNSAPPLRFPQPAGYDTAATQRALAVNKQVVRRATADDWLPVVRVTPRPRTFRAACDKTSRPGVQSGTTTTSIVTLDPQADEPTSNRTIVGGSDLLYASSAQLYLTTQSWQSQGFVARGFVDGVSTSLHGFDIAHPDAPVYLGTGTLPGNVVDRYALSEQDGYLRVATTVGSPVPPVGEGQAPAKAALSDSRVTVLRPQDGVLTKVGEVRGLGRGQKVFGVRFLGDIGYVVTFRQLDPLYTLDLSDPRHPAVRGELHISGYSSALYPLDAGRLLGVGAAVGSHQQQLGAQAEVFDVRRLSRPRLTGKLVWAQATSPAAEDHHALLWWPSKDLVVMPLSGYSGRQAQLVLRVGPTGKLTEIGRVRHESEQNSCCNVGFTRAAVVGDLLYSLSDSGIVTNPLDEVTRQTWLPFR